MTLVRPANTADIADIREIYAHHVLHSLASFEVEPPSMDEMRVRMESILAAGYPYLLAEAQGKVMGFAYASAYRARHGYRFTVEDSIYLRDGAQGKGVGRQLLQALLTQCEAKGFRQMIAVIGDSANAASISVHARLGFRFAGVLPSVGFKHGRWIDSVLMSKALGEGDRSQPRDRAV